MGLLVRFCVVSVARTDVNTASGTTKKKILIVEDDLNIRVGLRNSLAQEGYEVATAVNSFEAVMKMKEDVSIGIFDLDLPVVFGFAVSSWDLVGIFRDWQPNGSIIVVSTQEGYDAVKAKHWRIADRLVKPITPSCIKSLVKALDSHET